MGVVMAFVTATHPDLLSTAIRRIQNRDLSITQPFHGQSLPMLTGVVKVLGPVI
jgi:late competence protein required for DNA uptake (superfamily II DNA/RNA helicase)